MTDEADNTGKPEKKRPEPRRPGGKTKRQASKKAPRKAKKTYPLDDGSAHAIGLAKARNECCCLRNDLARLGQLTETDRLWTLLVEKEEELLDAELADLRQLGEGSVK
jgi:hypothetical protein